LYSKNTKNRAAKFVTQNALRFLVAFLREKIFTKLGDFLRQNSRLIH